MKDRKRKMKINHYEQDPQNNQLKKRCSNCGFFDSAHPTYDTFVFKCATHDVEISDDEIDETYCENFIDKDYENL